MIAFGRSHRTFKPWQSLFFRIFASIMSIVIIILVFQVLVVALMFTFQTRQFEREVFNAFQEHLQEALDVGAQAGTSWDLRSIGPALHMAADDRVSGLILRDSKGNTVLTFGKTPRGTTIGELVFTVELDPSFDFSELPVPDMLLRTTTDQSVRTMVIPSYPRPVEKQDIVGTVMLYEDPSETKLLGSIDVLVFSPMNYALTSLLLRRMVAAFFITIPIGLLIALIGSRLVARSVSLHASRISKALESLAGGRDDPAVPRSTMTELDQISESVDTLARQLASHERMRQQWLRGIAHDLNTPVTALRIAVDSAIDKIVPIDETVLSGMKDELEELERRVGSVLTLASMEAPDFKFRPEPIDVLDFADEVISSSMLGRQVALDVKAEQVLGDRRLLVIAIRELLENARKYAESDDPITWSIFLAEDGASAVMQVANQGSVEPSVIERVFEPWFRADQSRSLDGSGMGLAIVRHIMEAHQGTARMSSERGVVTIRLEWPQ